MLISTWLSFPIQCPAYHILTVKLSLFRHTLPLLKLVMTEKNVCWHICKPETHVSCCLCDFVFPDLFCYSSHSFSSANLLSVYIHCGSELQCFHYDTIITDTTIYCHFPLLVNVLIGCMLRNDDEMYVSTPVHELLLHERLHDHQYTNIYCQLDHQLTDREGLSICHWSNFLCLSSLDVKSRPCKFLITTIRLCLPQPTSSNEPVAYFCIL